MSITLNGVDQKVTAALDNGPLNPQQQSQSSLGFFLWTCPSTVPVGVSVGGLQDPASTSGTGMWLETYDNGGTTQFRLRYGQNGALGTAVFPSPLTVTADTTYRILLIYNAYNHSAVFHINTEANFAELTTQFLDVNVSEWVLGCRTINSTDEQFCGGDYSDLGFWDGGRSFSAVSATAGITWLLDSGNLPGTSDGNGDPTAPDQYYTLATDYQPTVGTAVAVGPAFSTALTLDFSPDTLERGGSADNIQISTPAVAPTSGNTVVRLNGASGPQLTVGTITGSGPYTIPVSAPANLAIQHGSGNSYHITIGAQTVTGGDVDIAPPTGYSYTNLSSPDTSSNQSILFGYTDIAPATGDQVVYENPSATDSGISVSVDATGIVTLNPAPTVSQTIGRYVIQADGTLGAEADFTYVVAASGNAVILNGGNPLPRSKGNYVQPGQLVFVPKHNGEPQGISMDGIVECDTVYLESEFPRLFAAIGKNYNKAGDDPGGSAPSEFRTPEAPTAVQDDSNWIVKIRY